jgi:4-hydroxybutyrate CoA-transferase
MSTTFVTAAEAVKHIQSGDRVFVQGQAATPTVLLDALAARASELRDVETVHLHLEGTAPHAHPDVAASFRPNAFFVGANLRLAVAEGRADYTRRSSSRRFPGSSARTCCRSTPRWCT